MSPALYGQVVDMIRREMARATPVSRPPATTTQRWPTPTFSDAPTTSVGSTGETEAAATDVWQIYDDTNGESCQFTTCTRVAYADAGGEILYAYYRNVFLDRHGRVTRLGAETRVVIDAPEACA